MNNLYRDLAPVTEAAWAEIELEASRTFKRHIAGRRVVDVRVARTLGSCSCPLFSPSRFWRH
jgi:uncharacterized linocin/CFP29 family protein